MVLGGVYWVPRHCRSFHLVPSFTLDNTLFQSDFAISVKLCLGVAGTPFPACLHDCCERGWLRPKLEAAGLLHGAGRGHRRLADIPVLQPGLLQQRLPDGSWRPATEPLGLNIAVINAFGPGHLFDRLAAVVAAVGGADSSAIQGRLFEQLAVAIARGNGRESAAGATTLSCLRRDCRAVLLSLKSSHEAESDSEVA